MSIDDEIKAAKQHLKSLYEKRDAIRAAEHQNKPSMVKRQENKEKRLLALRYFLGGMTMRGAAREAGLCITNDPWPKIRKAWHENYAAHYRHHWQLTRFTPISMDASYLRDHPPQTDLDPKPSSAC